MDKPSSEENENTLIVTNNLSAIESTHLIFLCWIHCAFSSSTALEVGCSYSLYRQESKAQRRLSEQRDWDIRSGMLIFHFYRQGVQSSERLSEQGHRRLGWELESRPTRHTDPFFVLHHVASFVLFSRTDYISPSTNWEVYPKCWTSTLWQYRYEIPRWSLPSWTLWLGRAKFTPKAIISVWRRLD